MPTASITLVTAKATAVKGKSKRRASISVKTGGTYLKGTACFLRCSAVFGR
ncbi:hypothetical protein [Bacillus siamensis]|uniref:hypothetical protein n=1 Tax=Bacillus siamensis TaxID=659243 RepID=UPI001595A665|nr:hypothetical protein [Bacillus siamensis]MED0772542.1 hypothetical protein [Bacillus siamensis]MED0776323.1 hypothetical protein [Bacillus siamensis]MED0778296.1 hypothetical protein [Bacillus siamensis]MED0835153.1 hypothetical protein [Bacillus siamensis]